VTVPKPSIVQMPTSEFSAQLPPGPVHPCETHSPNPSGELTHRLGGKHGSPSGGVEGAGTQLDAPPKKPLVHAPDAHTTPHAPQLFGSDAEFEQTPLQQTPSMTSAKS